MPNKKRLLFHILFENISQHVINSAKRKYTPFIIAPTGFFYEVAGQRVSEDEFFKQHPVELVRKNANKYGENLDTTHIK